MNDYLATYRKAIGDAAKPVAREIELIDLDALTYTQMREKTVPMSISWMKYDQCRYLLETSLKNIKDGRSKKEQREFRDLQEQRADLITLARAQAAGRKAK